MTSCDVDSGASGSPVFVLRNGQAQIMSVVSAKAEWNEQQVSLMTGLSNRLSVLLDEFERNDGVFRRSTAKPRQMQLDDPDRVKGARFLRP